MSVQGGKGIAAILVLFLLAGVACWYIHHPNRPRVINPEIGLKPGTWCNIELVSGGGSYTGTLISIDREAIILEVIHNPLIKVDDEMRTNPNPTVLQYWIPKSNISRMRIQIPRTENDADL